MAVGFSQALILPALFQCFLSLTRYSLVQSIPISDLSAEMLFYLCTSTSSCTSSLKTFWYGPTLAALIETRQPQDSGQAPCLGTEGNREGCEWLDLTVEDGPQGSQHKSLWQGSSVMAEFVIYCLDLSSQPTEELTHLLSLAIILKWQ